MIIKVNHHLQMGHRLHRPEGKCQNLHGHTWLVTLALEGDTDSDGKVYDYGELKRRWRGWLDEEFDHRMVLDTHDPLIERYGHGSSKQYDFILPGLKTVPFNPTVENLAAYFLAEAIAMFGSKYTYAIELWEGKNNAATAIE